MASRSVFAGLTLAAGAAASAMFCPSSAPLSCHNTTAYADTCCFNYPGGELLQTQFWDTAPATGPADSWTIHGLWPDNCDGTYPQYCDSSREYTNITAILSKLAPCTLKYMNKYWKDYQGNDESFWEHEFGKHGTCISTLQTKCYDNYHDNQEVADYFTRAVTLFKSLPSYQWLAEAGIVPSTTTTYTLSAIKEALKAKFGYYPVIGCNSKNELDELWYHYNVQGSVQTGTFVARAPVGSGDTCPATGIKYLPKYSSATTTLATVTTSGIAPTASVGPGVLSGAGKFAGATFIDPDGKGPGFLTKTGKWLRQSGATAASYTATPNADGTTFTLKSSNGPCGILADNSFSCATGVATSSFTFDGQYLGYNGVNVFYVDAVPTGTAQAVVYTSSHAASFQITWTGN